MNKLVDGVVVAMTPEEIEEWNANRPTDAEILAQKWEYVRSCLLYTSPSPRDPT